MLTGNVTLKGSDSYKKIDAKPFITFVWVLKLEAKKYLNILNCYCSKVFLTLVSLSNFVESVNICTKLRTTILIKTCRKTRELPDK